MSDCDIRPEYSRDGSAIAPVADCRWLGPVPMLMLPVEQGRGVGSQLIREGLPGIEFDGANGCVLPGHPDYQRLGFEPDPALTWNGVANPHFQRLVLRGQPPQGDVTYHAAFDACSG